MATFRCQATPHQVLEALSEACHRHGYSTSYQSNLKWFVCDDRKRLTLQFAAKATPIPEWCTQTALQITASLSRGSLFLLFLFFGGQALAVLAISLIPHRPGLALAFAFFALFCLFIALRIQQFARRSAGDNLQTIVHHLSRQFAITQSSSEIGRASCRE